MDRLDTTVEIDGKVLSVSDLLEVDEANLSDEFATQASRFAYFAVLAAQAEHKWLMAKKNTKEIQADAFLAAKEDHENIPVGGKTVSDALAESLALLDEEHAKAQEEELKALRAYKVVRAITDAFEQRMHMLQSLGASIRDEQQMTGMAVKDINPSDKLRRAIESRKTGKS